MNIRPATHDDLPAILDLYDIGRRTMRENGNESQWTNGYPQQNLIAQDINDGALFVVEGSGDTETPGIHGVFMFMIGDDETYAVIEDGAWLNDEPYGVIHRVASDGRVRGIVPLATSFALERTDNVRIDTHADNTIMRHVLEKAGFTHCGTIFCHDGSPRLAFHLVKQQS